jgi:hypothetical protein
VGARPAKVEGWRVSEWSVHHSSPSPNNVANSRLLAGIVVFLSFEFRQISALNYFWTSKAFEPCLFATLVGPCLSCRRHKSLDKNWQKKIVLPTWSRKSLVLLILDLSLNFFPVHELLSFSIHPD